jgi:hypothetical protein
MQNFDHNIGFGEKRLFFSSKIAKNCDHNIGPSSLFDNGSLVDGNSVEAILSQF